MNHQIVVIIFLVFVACLPRPVQAGLILSVDYEDGTFGNISLQSSGAGATKPASMPCPPISLYPNQPTSPAPSCAVSQSTSIVTSPTRTAESTKAQAYSLLPGDKGWLYTAYYNPATRNESEKWYIATAEGQERWIGFSIYVPSTYTDTSKDPNGTVVFQWHEMAWDGCDTGSGFYKSPQLLIQITSSTKHWQVRQETDSRGNVLCQDQAYVNRIDWDGGAVSYDTWIDWVIYTKIASDNTGILKIWKNGSLIVDQNNHPNVYKNADPGVNIKWGIYKPWWGSHTPDANDKLFTYVDNFKVGDGNSNFNEVAPKNSQPIMPASPSNLQIRLP